MASAQATLGHSEVRFDPGFGSSNVEGAAPLKIPSKNPLNVHIVNVHMLYMLCTIVAYANVCSCIC